MARTTSLLPDGQLEPNEAPGRELARRPAQRVEAAHAEGPRPNVDARQGTDRAAARDRSAGRRSPAATSSSGRAAAGSPPPPSRRSRRCRRPRSGGPSRGRRSHRARPPACRVSPSRSTTRSFGHFRRTVLAGRSATASAASAIARLTIAASCQTRLGSSHVGRKPRLSSSAVPGGAVQVRPSRPRPAVCSSATARQTSGSPRGQPAADDVVRRADDGEPLMAADVRRRLGHRHPAAAASIVSGRSSSNAWWSARTAVSRASSAMIVVIRISDVEIISMLTPASARVLNIRAA